MIYQSVTPILLVEQIEPSLFFWVGRLGFTKSAEVFEGNALGFVLLEKDQVQIMYQSYKSVQKDMPAVYERTIKEKSRAMIYCKVNNLEWIEKHLDGVEVVVPKRLTPYGATEIGIVEPAGHMVTFASFQDAQAGESNL